MISIQIDITDLQDLKVGNQSATLQGLKATCENVLRDGGRVIIKRAYINAPEEFVCGFNTQEEFNPWWNRVVAP